MQAQQQLEKLDNQQFPAPGKSESNPRKRALRIISGALSFVFFCVVGVIALEITFRLAGIGEGETQEPNQKIGSVHLPGKLVTYRLEGYSHEKINSQRMRDVEHSLAKPVGVKRIAILGDSATEALQVAMNETYAAQLQELLNSGAKQNKSPEKFEVFNFGCAGYSTGQEYLQYQQQVRQYKPDTVVVLYNFSDSSENIFVPTSADKVTPRPVFHIENNALVEDDSVVQMNADAFKPNPVMDYLRRESRIFGVFSQQNLMLSINEPLYLKIKRSFGKIPIPGIKHQNTGIIRPSYELPDPTKVASKILTDLNSNVQKDGGRLIVMTFPNVQGDRAFAKEQACLEETGRKENFDVVSLTPAFARASDYQSLFLKYHFSKHGHAVVAKVLSSVIEQHKY